MFVFVLILGILISEIVLYTRFSLFILRKPYFIQDTFFCRIDVGRHRFHKPTFYLRSRSERNWVQQWRHLRHRRLPEFPDE